MTLAVLTAVSVGLSTTSVSMQSINGVRAVRLHKYWLLMRASFLLWQSGSTGEKCEHAAMGLVWPRSGRSHLRRADQNNAACCIYCGQTPLLLHAVFRLTVEPLVHR